MEMPPKAMRIWSRAAEKADRGRDATRVAAVALFRKDRLCMVKLRLRCESKAGRSWRKDLLEDGGYLKLQLCCELKNARIVGVCRACNSAEEVVAKRCGWESKLRRVEDIECLGTKLKIESLAHGKGL